MIDVLQNQAERLSQRELVDRALVLDCDNVLVSHSVAESTVCGDFVRERVSPSCSEENLSVWSTYGIPLVQFLSLGDRDVPVASIDWCPVVDD